MGAYENPRYIQKDPTAFGKGFVETYKAITDDISTKKKEKEAKERLDTQQEQAQQRIDIEKQKVLAAEKEREILRESKAMKNAQDMYNLSNLDPSALGESAINLLTPRQQEWAENEVKKQKLGVEYGEEYGKTNQRLMKELVQVKGVSTMFSESLPVFKELVTSNRLTKSPEKAFVHDVYNDVHSGRAKFVAIPHGGTVIHGTHANGDTYIVPLSDVINNPEKWSLESKVDLETNEFIDLMVAPKSSSGKGLGYLSDTVTERINGGVVTKLDYNKSKAKFMNSTYFADYLGNSEVSNSILYDHMTKEQRKIVLGNDKEIDKGITEEGAKKRDAQIMMLKDFVSEHIIQQRQPEEKVKLWAPKTPKTQKTVPASPEYKEEIISGIREISNDLASGKATAESITEFIQSKLGAAVTLEEIDIPIDAEGNMETKTFITGRGISDIPGQILPEINIDITKILAKKDKSALIAKLAEIGGLTKQEALSLSKIKSVKKEDPNKKGWDPNAPFKK